MQQPTGKICRDCDTWLPMSAYMRNKTNIRNACVSCQRSDGTSAALACMSCALVFPAWSIAANGYCMACRSRYQQDRRDGITYHRQCCSCDADMTVSFYRLNAPRVFCSRTCKDAFRDAARSLEILMSKPDRICPHCGNTLMRSMRAHAVYCSEKCNSSAHNATRKARMKILVDGEVVRIPRAYIIERDGSRCHMCRRKCSGTNLHLDHVIPLSRGGTHTLENLRVACAKCNLSKRADAVGEQLMLVG